MNLIGFVYLVLGSVLGACWPLRPEAFSRDLTLSDPVALPATPVPMFAA